MPDHEKGAVPADITLPGCRPTPLASYLKALGVFRLIVEQKADPEARAAWRNDTFILRTKLDREALTRFFLQGYQPSGIVAPWNGGSGFFPKDNKKGGEALEASDDPRFQALQSAFRFSRKALQKLGLKERPEQDQKRQLLQECRNSFPDELLAWIESAYVLTADGVSYPPLLGTGGNDGRLDFTNNFHQRIGEIFNLGNGKDSIDAATLLDEALFREPARKTSAAAIGQFSPSGTGGANSGTGFEGSNAVNAWDYILMLEGAQVFAAATVKRLGSLRSGELAYPFCVRTRGVGYGSSAEQDAADSRSEIWTPLWQRSFSYPELRAVFSEGRVQYQGRAAVDGLDFVRAVRSFGVDRGILEFVRYAFLVRNGLAYFAVPLDRVRVRYEEKVTQLLGPLEDWFDSVRRAADFSSRMASAIRRLDQAVYDFSLQTDNIRTCELLIALGQTERALSQNPAKAREKGIRPLPPLDPKWIVLSDDQSMEFRLAAALGSLYAKYRVPSQSEPMPMAFRCHLEAVEAVRSKGHCYHYRFLEHGSRDVAWNAGTLEASLINVFQRRLILAGKGQGNSLSETAARGANRGDIASFLEGGIHEDRFEELLWGLAMIDWANPAARQGDSRFGTSNPPTAEEPPSLPAIYGLLKLCFLPEKLQTDLQDFQPVPPVPAIHRLAASGQGTEAAKLAVQRLRASGNPPLVRNLTAQGDRSARRAAAALLFPVDRTTVRLIRKQLLDREALSAASQQLQYT